MGMDIINLDELPRKNPEDKWIINPRWFRHLASPELLPYHDTFDFLYRHWLGRELAWQRETGRSFRIQPMEIVDAILRRATLAVPIGDPVPTIEMLIEIHPDGSKVAKVLPRWLLRTVTTEDIRRLNRSAVRNNTPRPDQFTSHVTLIMEVSRFDPEAGKYLGIRNVFVAPAHFLIKPRLGISIIGPKPYAVYCHTFGDAEKEERPKHFYYGITRRAWQERWAEHARAINSGSNLKFHKTFREEVARDQVSYIGHEIVHVADSIEELYEWEEDLVAAAWGDPMLLNMIPGGKAGFAHMAKHGMLGRQSIIRPDKRDKLFEEWVTARGRAGLPAPWVSERWQNPDWASAFVCSGVGRLTEQQVRHIRLLGEQGRPVEQIREVVCARTLEQVKKVLSGKTYDRVT